MPLWKAVTKVRPIGLVNVFEYVDWFEADTEDQARALYQVEAEASGISKHPHTYTLTQEPKLSQPAE